MINNTHLENAKFIVHTTGMRKYSGKLIAVIFGLVLLFELGTLAYYWFRAKPFEGKADVVIKHSSTQEKISIDTQKATQFIKSIPSAMRADSVKVNIYDIIPNENNITLAFFLPVTLTTAGLSDTGALCTEPKLSSDGRSSEIDFYATPKKLAAQIGIKKPIQKLTICSWNVSDMRPCVRNTICLLIFPPPNRRFQT